jgi:Domain of unknown function (DUF222)/HNH endonuclease
MSCAHWLAWRVGWDLVTARERVRVACKLAGFPMIDDALRRGEVSYSKVRAMVRVATPANEALLLEYARLMTASQLEKLTRKYALVQRHGQAPHPLDDEQRRYVRRRDTEDGMVKIEAVLHPEEAELIWTTLNHAATQLARELDPPASDDSAESRAATQGRRDTATPLLQTAAGSECEVAVTSPEAVPPCNAVDGRSRWDATACQSNDSAESRQVLPATDATATATSFPEPVQPCVSDDSAESSALEAHSVSSAVDGASLPGATLGVSDDSAESRAVPRTPDPIPASSPGHIVTHRIATITPGPATTAGGSASVLHQQADAARRAFNRADALVSLAQAYLRGDRPNRSPIEITLTIPASSLHADAADPLEAGEMGESFLSTEAARRLSCDAGVVKVIEDEHGVPLSVGRKQRTIAGALKRALYKRDTACTYPGCTHRIFLEGHHIQHWADGGETSLTNIALLCSSHHRHVHEYGYTIELGSDQRPRFRDPHGRLVVAAPVRPVMADLGWPRIRAMNESLAIDADTSACEWDGTPADYGTLVGHLVVADGLR